MGRSNQNTNIISTETSGGNSAYLPSFPPVSSTPHHHPPPHHFQSNMHPHQHPSPPSSSVSLLSHSQYLNLTSGSHLYESNNNIPPPARVYSPLSNGSNSSSGSFISSTSNGSGHNSHPINNNNGSLSIMDNINSVLKYEYEDFPQEPDGGPIKIDTWKEHVAVFNIDQVGVMCDVLLQEGEMSRLVDLLSSVGKEFIGKSEKILMAQAHVAFHAALQDARKFTQVYKILETNTFSPQYHLKLQKLWFEAHYKEAEITRGRPLGAVDKYRIRKKHGLPRTIWDGEETVYCFKERSRNALKDSFRVEKYPNLEEKKKLSNETGLTMTQVGNWFKNKRQREKDKERGTEEGRRNKNNNFNPNAIAASMNPELLGMMLNPVNQAHGHLHHHPHQQVQLAPLSPEDLENTFIRKTRLDEARLKSYIDEGIYSAAAAAAAASSGSSTQANLSAYLHNANNGGNPNNNGIARHLVLPGKSDITIGIVGPSPPIHHHQQSPRSNNGLTITAVHSPNNCSPHQHQHHQQQQNQHQQHPHHSPKDNNNGNAAASSENSSDLYGNHRSRNSGGSSPTVVRFGADLVPYHHIYHHHHHHQSGSPGQGGGYEGGLPPLIHGNNIAALSHA
ncbi:unnamed protein product [Orchesella dallaii]|uniref:Homeobox domain-containing protein n=1 Tax=Orchesella dallaii TaxID=48710 RepID=A0ABP1QRY2_9HEXA